MGLFGFFGSNKKRGLSIQDSALVSLEIEGQLKDKFYIPEPTKSLLWVTREDTSKISSPLSIKLTLSINDGGVSASVDEGHNFYGEPSLIWTNLPVQKNQDLEQKPMYYPSYSSLSPTHRYQYLNWLQDVTRPTNLSYVFLYYYGLERHLLVGDFELAVQEILRLLKHHDKGTFRAYAQEALIVAILHKKRLDILKDVADDLIGTSNEVLVIRKGLGLPVTARELMGLASQVRFTNKRYIKLRAAEFEKALSEHLVRYERTKGPLLEVIPTNDMRYEESNIFANSSLPKETRAVMIPQIILDDRFASTVRSLLEQAHEDTKKGKRKAT